MTLQEIIDFLSMRDASKVVPIGFDSPHSYRGDYSELAFEPRRNVTIGEMLDSARSALGTVYKGYKGGDYKMYPDTACHLANYGCSGEDIGIVLMEYMVGQHTLASSALDRTGTENPIDQAYCDGYEAACENFVKSAALDRPTAEQEREAFDAWWRTGIHWSAGDSRGWQGVAQAAWQARAALNAPTSQSAPAELTERERFIWNLGHAAGLRAENRGEKAKDEKPTENGPLAVVTHEQESLMHPATQVFFRAGLLACREYMARFVSHESEQIAASIRANWWPSLGEDFGAPRLLQWSELTVGEYGAEDFRAKTLDEVSPTLEALPIALQFLDSLDRAVAKEKTDGEE